MRVYINIVSRMPIGCPGAQRKSYHFYLLYILSFYYSLTRLAAPALYTPGRRMAQEYGTMNGAFA